MSDIWSSVYSRMGERTESSPGTLPASTIALRSVATLHEEREREREREISDETNECIVHVVHAVNIRYTDNCLNALTIHYSTLQY